MFPFFLKFFSGALRNRVESRSDDASKAPRGSVVAVVAGAASGTKHIWGIGQRPFAKARRLRALTPDHLSQREKGGTRDRVPETPPCPRLADQSGRLTWASERRRGHASSAGRQVRCRLNRRAAVATSLPSTRDKYPRTPCGRPIKASEVGNFPHSDSECG